jgi:hypothetical protein
MIDIVISQHHHLIPLPFHKVSWWYKGYFYPFTKFHDGTKVNGWTHFKIWCDRYGHVIFCPTNQFIQLTANCKTGVWVEELNLCVWISKSNIRLRLEDDNQHLNLNLYKGYFYPFTKFHDGTKDTSTSGSNFKKEKSHTELLLIYILNKPAKFLV